MPNCVLLSIMCIVCYIFQEIMLRIHYNKPVEVLVTLMHYGKILHVGVVSRQI